MQPTVRVMDRAKREIIRLMVRIWVIGIALGFATCAPIGPTNIAMIQRGLRRGFGTAWWFGTGAVAGDMALFTLVYLGVAPFLLEIVWLKLALWTAGAAYLAYLGVDSIRGELNLESTDEMAAESLPRTFVSGFGVNILNPSALASWLVVGGSALSVAFSGGYAGNAWLLITSVAVGCLLFVAVLAAALKFGRRLVQGWLLRAINVGAGLVILGFAAWFGAEAVRLAIASL